MKKMLICGLLALVCAWTATVARAETVVAVGSMKSAETLLTKLDDVAAVTERDDFKAFLGVAKFFASADGPVGVILDTGRPAGIVAYLKDGACEGECKGCPVAAVVALPIRDWDKLGSFLKSKDVQLEDLGDNQWKLTATGGKVFFGKKADGWLLASDKKESFPNDVDFEKFIIENTERVDVGFTIFAGNVPDKFKELAVQKAGECIKKCAKKHLHGKAPSEAAVAAFGKLMGGLECGLKDLNTITYGHFWDMDADEYSLRLTVTGKEGTKLAQKLAGIGAPRKTNFAGFRCPEATLTLAGSGIIKPLSDELLKEHQACIAEKVEKKIRKKAEKKGFDADGAVAFFKENQKLIYDVIVSGDVDFAAFLNLEQDNLVFAKARYVPDGYAWEAQLKKVVAFVKEKKADKAAKCVLKSGSAECGEYHAYWAEFKLPEKLQGAERDAVVKALGGEAIPAAMVFAPKAVYFAAGKNAGEVLKKCIEASAEPKEMSTYYAHLDLADLLKGAAACPVHFPNKAQVEKAARRMGDLEKALIILEPAAVENGVQFRLRATTPVFKMMNAF